MDSLWGCPLGVFYYNYENQNWIIILFVSAVCFREHINESAIALVYYIEYNEDFQSNSMKKLLEKLQIIQVGNIKGSTLLASNLYI